MFLFPITRLYDRKITQGVTVNSEIGPEMDEETRAESELDAWEVYRTNPQEVYLRFLVANGGNHEESLDIVRRCRSQRIKA